MSGRRLHRWCRDHGLVATLATFLVRPAIHRDNDEL